MNSFFVHSSEHHGGEEVEWKVETVQVKFDMMLLREEKEQTTHNLYNYTALLLFSVDTLYTS
jgi:hypothetical protein